MLAPIIALQRDVFLTNSDCVTLNVSSAGQLERVEQEARFLLGVTVSQAQH